MQDAIGSMASIADSSVTKNLFMSLVKNYQLVNDAGEFEKAEDGIDDSTETQLDNQSTFEKEMKR